MALTQTQKDYLVHYEDEYTAAKSRLEEAQKDLRAAKQRVFDVTAEVSAAGARLTAFRDAIARLPQDL